MTLIGGLHLKDRLRAPLCGRFVRVVLDLQSRYSKYKHCIRSNIYETPTCDYGATAIADRRACYSVPVQHSVVRQRMTNLLVSAHRYTIFPNRTTVRLTDIWVISVRPFFQKSGYIDGGNTAHEINLKYLQTPSARLIWSL